MAQVQAYIRRRLLAPGHVVVETNGKQRDVKQEEESNDEGVKVVLSHTDHERAKRCAISGTLFGYVCSRNCGPNALGCEKRAQQGVLMVKSKSKSVPIGQWAQLQQRRIREDNTRSNLCRKTRSC